MQLKVFVVPLKNAEAVDPEMNGFLRGHRVLTVLKEFLNESNESAGESS